MWTERVLPERGAISYHSTRRSLWIRSNAGGMEYALREEEERERAPVRRRAVKSVPSDLAWRSVALGRPARSIRLKPRPPERPWLALFDQPMELAPRASVSGWILAPLRVDILVDGAPAVLELSLRPVKAAWFGRSEQGVLCDAARGTLLDSASLARERAQLAGDLLALPLSVRNETESPVELRRLCAYNDGIAVYGLLGETPVLGDALECSLAEGGTRVSVRRGAPQRSGLFDAAPVELCAARQSPQERFFARSFELLRVIAGM